MYKYYSELESKSNFKTYLKGTSNDRDIFLLEVPVSRELLNKITPLFPKIQIIDTLITSLDENLITSSNSSKKFSYNDWLIISDFFNSIEERYMITRENYFSISNNTWDIYYMFNDIYQNIPALIILFPNYKDFLTETECELEESLKLIRQTLKIHIPKEKEEGIVCPDAWYITPSGYLYNTGLGHKQGNLIYPLQYEIIDTLKHSGNVRYTNNYSKIKEILKRGYITDEELQYYSNLTYKLPTILTKEIEREEHCLKHFIESSEEERVKLRYPNTERSYQPNLITLIVGHLAAETELYRSFSRLNDSKRKKEILAKLIYLTLNEMDEILVRFSNFSKVSSVLPNTIITSSLSSIKDFKEYLDRGWTLDIIPRIVYDNQTDTLEESNLDSPIISRYLDKELNNYQGKGKILIFKKREDLTL